MKFQVNPVLWKPPMILGALLCAGIPIAAVAWTSSKAASMKASIKPPVSVESSSAKERGAGGFQEWFEGSGNPFLTTAQTNQRKLKEVLSKVEAALLGRGDVEEVVILAGQSREGGGSTAKPKAVVCLRMRSGPVPVSVVDAAGSLLSLALEDATAEEIEVIDSRTGVRARARSLDAAESMVARELLLLEQSCQQEEWLLAQGSVGAVQFNPNDSTGIRSEVKKQPNPPAQAASAFNQSGGSVELKEQSWVRFAWIWFVSALCVLGAALAMALWPRHHWRGRIVDDPALARPDGSVAQSGNQQLGTAAVGTAAMGTGAMETASTGKTELWSAPLSCSLHRCIAQKPALIAATLVQRLEGAPGARQAVATMMLELEPWASERILSSLPDRSLDALEATIQQPPAPVSPQQVRALAEALVSLRNAA